MQVLKSAIPDVILIEPKVFQDERGFFLETYQVRKYAEAGITATFVQENLSGSRRGVLRGLHYQIRHTQGKLVTVVAGKVFDVAVDLRRSSPTFGKWVGTFLSAEDRRQLWIPPGFAHGFYVVSPWADLVYKVTDFYSPESERTLRWDDPTVAVAWPMVGSEPPILSPKDTRGVLLGDAELFD
jgi:dTDP-4-dehydrorhamnose 3,5-epimerase